jgi:hypothetical protein
MPGLFGKYSRQGTTSLSPFFSGFITNSVRTSKYRSRTFVISALGSILISFWSVNTSSTSVGSKLWLLLGVQTPSWKSSNLVQVEATQEHTQIPWCAGLSFHNSSFSSFWGTSTSCSILVWIAGEWKWHSHHHFISQYRSLENHMDDLYLQVICRVTHGKPAGIGHPQVL